MKALLTGGAGFIGSHLTGNLLTHDFKVDCVDDLSTGCLENLEGWKNHPGFRFFEGRAEDESLMEPLVEQADVIYHLAASVGVKNIMSNTVHSIENNLSGTLVNLKLAHKYGKRIFIFSTSEVYGKTSRFPFEEEDDVVLGPVSKIRWSYAAAKLVDDYLARAYFYEKQTKVTMVRLFNTIGTGQVGHYGMVVPRFFEQARSNQAITIYGDGSQTRCFTDVRDVVEVLRRLINEPKSHGELINVGSTEELSILQLAEKIRLITQSQSDMKFIPFETVYGPHFEDMKRRVPNVSKLKAITQFQFKYGLNETLSWIQRQHQSTTAEIASVMDPEIVIKPVSFSDGLGVDN